MLFQFQEIPWEGFFPTVDGSYAPLEHAALPVDPVQVLRSGEFDPMPTMIGVCRDEGTLYVASLLTNVTQMEADWKNIAAVVFYNKDGKSLTQEQETSIGIMKR